MAQSLSQVLLHLVFSTKDRRPSLHSAPFRCEMHRYLAGFSKKLHCPALIVGGTEDHGHPLVEPPRTVAIADLVKELKRTSFSWAKRHSIGFLWQNGYGAFSVSESLRAKVIRYIADQEARHRKVSFEDEYRRFLAQHRVVFDERYVWD